MADESPRISCRKRQRRKWNDVEELSISSTASVPASGGLDDIINHNRCGVSASLSTENITLSSARTLFLTSSDGQSKMNQQESTECACCYRYQHRCHRLAAFLIVITKLLMLCSPSFSLTQSPSSLSRDGVSRNRRRSSYQQKFINHDFPFDVRSTAAFYPSTLFSSRTSVSNGASSSAGATTTVGPTVSSTPTENDSICQQSHNDEKDEPLKSRYMSKAYKVGGDTDANSNLQGLSRSFQNMFSRSTTERQRFVTGQYPVIVSVIENPTLKWLNLGRSDISTAVVLVNGTTIDRSLASFDRYQWLDDEERQELHDRYATVSMELLAEINLAKPGYLQILSRDGGPGSAASRMFQHQQQRAAAGRDGPFPFSWLQQQQQQKQLNGHEFHGVEGRIDGRNCRREKLWVTGFSLASRRGFIKSVDIHTGRIDSINSRSESMILWPNEVNHVPKTEFLAPGRSVMTANASSVLHAPPAPHRPQDALLVSDGFLVPGKDRGGIYVVKNPCDEVSEWSIRLTNPVSRHQWFYHRAVWVDLTGDGRLSVLTARAKLRKSSDDPSKQQALSESGSQLVSQPRNGQLLWLEMPQPHHYDESTGTPLDKDGTIFDPFSARHLPWKEHVLATGPDVMFAVADLDPNDDTIEVLASQFFDKKVTLQSIKRGLKPRVTFSRVIDDRCGAAFGGILADLDPGKHESSHRVVDSGSTVPSLDFGDSFSHLLVTSHECDYDSTEIPRSAEGDGTFVGLNERLVDAKLPDNNGKAQGSTQGGSLFAYRVPTKHKDAWKTDTWKRTTVATGFRVKSQLWNVINPGAPGFCYTFHAHKDDSARGKRPIIAIAGDCAESAYIYRPQDSVGDSTSDLIFDNTADVDRNAHYKLMCEIECGATVGSIAVGYDDLCQAEQESGYAKVYIPCFERDKILVFALGSGESDYDRF